jgi:hypothetical protein
MFERKRSEGETARWRINLVSSIIEGVELII